MARANDLYSQFVGLAKIVLPVLGLALLSSLFLLSDQTREVGELPYSDVELEEIVESQSVLGPVYHARLDNGSAVEIRAQTARPVLTAPGEYEASEVTGQIVTQGGATISIVGGAARVDENVREATIREGLRIVHSDGYILTARGGTSRFDGTAAQSEGDVVLKGPGLTLTAERAELRPNPETESQVVVFSGGVRVLYTP